MQLGNGLTGSMIGKHDVGSLRNSGRHWHSHFQHVHDHAQAQASQGQGVRSTEQQLEQKSMTVGPRM
jgi:hypothetical protein